MLLAVPALRALRARDPNNALVLAAQPRIGRLLAALEVVDRALAFDGLGLDTLFTAEGPPPPALRAAGRVVCWFGSGDEGFVRRLRAVVPDAVVAAPHAGGPVWEHLLASTGAAREDPAGLCAPVRVPSAVLAEGRRQLRETGWDGQSRLVVLHPGAGGRVKQWPAEGFAAIVDRLVPGLVPVIHEGPADRDAVGALLGLRPGPWLRLVDPPLETLAGVLGHAGAYVGNDSGVSHLAATVGTPAVILFREANLRWRPWSAGADVVTDFSGALEALAVRLGGAAPA